MSDEGGAGMISNSPTNAEWFRRFMKGCHRRMGDVWMPDRPITIHELKAVVEFMEADWVTFAGDAVGQYNTAITACLFIAGIFAALRVGKSGFGSNEEELGRSGELHSSSSCAADAIRKIQEGNRREIILSAIGAHHNLGSTHSTMVLPRLGNDVKRGSHKWSVVREQEREKSHYSGSGCEAAWRTGKGAKEISQLDP
jgi:hypothetical protein